MNISPLRATEGKIPLDNLWLDETLVIRIKEWQEKSFRVENELKAHRERGKFIIKNLSKRGTPLPLANESMKNSLFKKEEKQQIENKGKDSPKFLGRKEMRSYSHRPLKFEKIRELTNTTIEESSQRESYIRPAIHLKKKKEDLPQFKFLIGSGNNSELVRKVLQTRSDWVETTSTNFFFNFCWHPTSKPIRFDILKPKKFPYNQVVNHFEFHSELTNKENLIKNLQAYCLRKKINLFDLTPTTFLIEISEQPSEESLEEFKIFFDKIASNPIPSSTLFFDSFLCLTDNEINIKSMKFNSTPEISVGESNLIDMQADEKDFSKKGSQVIRRISLNSSKESSGKLREGVNNSTSFIQPKMHPSLFKGQNIWLMKPNDCNRGRGIKLFNDWQTFSNCLKEQAQSLIQGKVNKKLLNGLRLFNQDLPNKWEMRDIIKSKIRGKNCIVQKYIEDPLLINGRKFDIRVWVLLDFDLNVYFFREGYLRTSSNAYHLSGENLNNLYIHLTNNAIQKNSNKYGQFEMGNQISFSSFERYIKEKNLKVDFRGKILPRMKELIMISMESVKEKINPNNRSLCFEIFGYDFIIDISGKTWLIEVNTNPCLEESSPLLKKLIPRMIDDGMRLTIDLIFSSHKNQFIKEGTADSGVTKSEFQVDGYGGHENIWEKIGSITKV